MPQPIGVILDRRGVLSVSGPDRKAFLQGLVSNDVDKVAEDKAVWAALLTPQGKFLHEFFISERGETLFLDAESERLADLKTRLSRYKLRAKVQIDERSDLCVAVGFGAAENTLDLPSAPGAAKQLGTDGTVYADPRHAGIGVRMLLPRDGAASALRDLGFETGEVGVYDVLRLRLGLPEGGRDLIVEKSFLMDSGFDELHGVDFKKGCYVGQELTARMKWRALVKKRLLPVLLTGPLPEAGTPLKTDDGKEAGELRSITAENGGGIAMALIRLEHLPHGPFRAGEATAAPIVPDWVTLPDPDSGA